MNAANDILWRLFVGITRLDILRPVQLLHHVKTTNKRDAAGRDKTVNIIAS